MKALDGEAFEAAVADWLEVADESGIALDGKTATGSGDPAKAWPALHLLSAYGGDLQAALASMPVDGKTHEHRQALQMLEILPIEGAVITADAMFCQRDLSEKVLQKKGISSGRSRTINPN